MMVFDLFMQEPRIDMNQRWQRPLLDESLTPYIEIDAARLEKNLQTMQEKASRASVTLRPHIKTHKSLYIARRQRALGARGITVSKPSEGEVFIRGGERDELLAYPVIRAESIASLLRLAAQHQAKVTLIVDASSKMLSSDKGPHGTNASGFGVAVDENDVCYEVSRLSKEHGFMLWQENAPHVCSLLRIYPNRSCAVMAQSDSYVLHHADGQAEIQPVDACGRFI